MIERIIHKVDDQGVFSLLIKVEFSFVSSASFYAYLYSITILLLLLLWISKLFISYFQ